MTNLGSAARWIARIGIITTSATVTSSPRCCVATVLGGEQSGHVINARGLDDGDSLATSLLLLQALSEMDVPLHGRRRSWNVCRRSWSMPVRDGRLLEDATAV
jgi:phosphomannomutase